MNKYDNAGVNMKVLLQGKISRRYIYTALLLALLLGCGEPVKNPQLIAHYAFDDNTRDNVGAKDGKIIGSASFVDGQIGGAIRFNGAGDYIVLPSGVVNAENLTIAAWIYWDGGAPWQNIFDFGNNADEYMYMTPRTGNETCRFGICKGKDHQMLETSPLAVGQWTHVAVTLNGVTGAIYINGALVVSDSITLKPSDINPAKNCLGKSQWRMDPLFKGRIDDLRIYDSALPGDYIAALARGVSAASVRSGGSTSASSVIARPTDAMTNSYWRTKAELEADGEYGTDGYIIWRMKAQDGVWLDTFDVNWGGESQYNVEQRPAYIGAISTSTPALGHWSGGNFPGGKSWYAKMQLPDPPHQLVKVGAYLMGEPYDTTLDPVFIIGRADAQPFRLTLIMNDGADGPNTWNVTVNAGSAGSANIVNQGSGVKDALTYFIFDIGAGMDPIQVAIVYNQNNVSSRRRGEIAGFAFDPYVAAGK
ncbi:LamG domain-containing protein [Candidatus Sumerlaeota bacterium]|nr:LamG domain-containing protein [Candidatus Sumerlaeota bacterium]